MATVTPNFNWPVPTPTDLVKDGATAIEALGDSIDASLVDLKGGTTGQVLSKTTGTDMDFTWVTTDDANAIQNSIVDAKGDLISATAADTPARIAVGADYGFLQANSGAATGIEWNATAWTSYTPTVTAGTGSFTTVSAVGAWIRIGRLCVVRQSITITTNGTAGGNIQATLPFNSSNDVGVFREGAATGNCGVVQGNGASAVYRTFTNGYPGGSGYTLLGTLSYEVQ
jgi:hypothetical protein